MQMKRTRGRVWKTIAHIAEYQISNDGRVRHIASPLGVFLVPSFSTKGRPRYHIRWKGGSFAVEAHILVAQAFLPPQPEGKTWVLHRDDDPLNCIDTNLRWGDHRENVADWQINRRLRSGYHPSNGRSVGIRPAPTYPLRKKKKYKLTASQVVEIIGAEGLHKNIAAKFGISRVQVGRIKSGNCWASLPKLA